MMEFNINEWEEKLLSYLKEKIKNNQYDGFEDVVETYKDLAFEIQEILEYAAQNATGDQKEKIWKLYKEFSYNNAGEMVEKLNRLGYALKRDDNYKKVCEAISNQAYRIMERTRYAQRSEVQYLITRIFVVNEKEISPLLIKAFNPIWSDELFRIFIYSFLGGILGETKEGGEK